MGNMYPFEVYVSGGWLPFTQNFKEQINAELYLYKLKSSEDNNSKHSLSLNFEPKFTNAELQVETVRREKLNTEASRLQDQARQRTINNYKNPLWNPCEVCGRKHENYTCCEQCNYGTHTCHFCGDDLGHSEVSACYILEGMGD